jgi:hypothetical protein
MPIGSRFLLRSSVLLYSLSAVAYAQVIPPMSGVITTLSPSKAISGGAMWRARAQDGSTTQWYLSDDLVLLSPGTYRFEARTVNSPCSAPPPLVYTVSANKVGYARLEYSCA